MGASCVATGGLICEPRDAWRDIDRDGDGLHRPPGRPRERCRLSSSVTRDPSNVWHDAARDVLVPQRPSRRRRAAFSFVVTAQPPFGRMCGATSNGTSRPPGRRDVIVRADAGDRFGDAGTRGTGGVAASVRCRVTATCTHRPSCPYCVSAVRRSCGSYRRRTLRSSAGCFWRWATVCFGPRSSPWSATHTLPSDPRPPRAATATTVLSSSTLRRPSGRLRRRHSRVPWPGPCQRL